MKAIIDLSQYQSKSGLLESLVMKLGLDPARVADLDSLYQSLIASSGDLDIVFIHKAKLAKALSVYFGMLTMTIEEVGESRRDLKTYTYYDEEEVKDEDGTGQKNV